MKKNKIKDNPVPSLEFSNKDLNYLIESLLNGEEIGIISKTYLAKLL